MSEEVIGKDDNIGIRLHSIVHPDHRTTVVTFELFAFPSSNGGEHRQLVLLPQAVDCAHDATGKYDHQSIVRQAGEKLKADFSRVMETLTCGL